MHLVSRFTLIVSCLLLSACSLLKPPPEPLSYDSRMEMVPTSGAPLKGKVTIYWDQYQIPFIEAENDEDAAVALGIVHAHLRLGVIQMARRVAQGRLSEMIGFPGVTLDQTFRILDFDRAVPEMIRTMPPESRAWIEGFVAGLNYYQANTPDLPHEYTVMGLEKEPFTVADVLTTGRLISSDQLWTVWLALMRARTRDDWPTIYADILKNGFRATASFNDMKMDDPDEVLGGYRISGSNAIVVSGKRSPTGAALLSGDPHLGFTAPNIWLLAGVKSPSMNVVGVMPTGLPVFAVGRNPKIAWTGTSSYGVTSSFIDLSDVPDAQITAHEEKLKVRFEPEPRTITVRDSKYGPLVSDVEKLQDINPPPIALRWVGHRPSDEVGAFLHAAKAENFEQFRDAFKTYAVAGMNFVYGDVDGNIGEVQAIRTFQRDKLPNGGVLPDIINPPAAIEPAWQGFYDATTLPAAYNPEEGYLANANNRPSNSRQRVGFMFSTNDRIERINQVLGTSGTITIDKLKYLHQDVYMSSSVHLRDAMIARGREIGMSGTLTTEQAAAFRDIANWNGYYDTDSRGALAYEFFLFGYIKNLYAAEYRNTPLWRVTEVIGLEWKLLPDLKRYDRDRLIEAFTAGLDAANKALRTYANWGDAHRLKLVHPFAAIPLVGGNYRYGNYPVGGSTQTLMKRGHKRTGDDYTALYGAGARILVDLSDIDSNYFVLLGGEDGWLNSANFLDQIPLWLDGKYIQLPLRPDKIHARAVRVMEISP